MAITSPTFSSRTYWLVVLGLALVFTLVASYTFETKVQPYGDNTTYYILAKALAQGDGYREIHNPTQPLHYHFPPGYPAFMSLFMHLLGQEVFSMKVLNSTVLGISILLLFGLGVRLSQRLVLSVVACLLVIFNPSLLLFGSALMSEVLFLALTLLTFHTYLNWKNRPGYGRLVILTLTLAAAFYVRSLGVALLGGVLLSMIWHRQWKASLITLVIFITAVVPWSLRNQNVGGSYTGQLMMKNPYNAALGKMELSDWPVRIWENFTRYLSHDLPDAFYKYVEAIDYSIAGWYTYIPGALILLAVGYGIYRMPQHRPVFLWSILGTCAILLLWPPAWFGVRFILPLVPILTFFAVWGVAEALTILAKKVNPNTKNPGYAWMPLICLVCLIPIRPQVVRLHQATTLDENNAYRNYYTAADWCKQNLPQTATICTRKGSLFYLHAERPVTMFIRSADPQEIIDHFNEVGVTHVVLDNLGYRDVGAYLDPAIQANPDKFLLIIAWDNPFTGVFQYFPEGIPEHLIQPQP